MKPMIGEGKLFDERFHFTLDNHSSGDMQFCPQTKENSKLKDDYRIEIEVREKSPQNSDSCKFLRQI
jgi:hypothetical protein